VAATGFGAARIIPCVALRDRFSETLQAALMVARCGGCQRSEEKAENGRNGLHNNSEYFREQVGRAFKARSL
jgi:hypothetical protein